MAVLKFKSSPVIASLLLLSTSALGNLYVTEPLEGTTWTAGQNQTVSWKDDGSDPSLSKFGQSSVGIYVGSSTVQTMVQEIVSSVDVATTESIVFTPDPSAGADGDYYFIRFQSLGLKDANDTAYPAEAFSATFTMSGMTGSFNASERSEIGTVAAAATGPPSTSVVAATVPITSHTPETVPTSSGDAAANGAGHRIGSVSLLGASLGVVVLMATWFN